MRRRHQRVSPSRCCGPAPASRNPAAWSKVTVDYTGWTTDGKMFDSSVVRGKPMTLELDGVIAGWTEGVALMVEGERTALLDSGEPRLQGRSRPAEGHAGLRHRAGQDRIDVESGFSRTTYSSDIYGYV